MINILLNPNSLSEVDMCWFFSNRTYHYMIKGTEVKKLNLPTVPLSYKHIIEKLNIAYRIKNDTIEFWNSEHYDIKEVILPLYIKTDNGYKYIKQHTGQILTAETLYSAVVLAKSIVWPEVEKLWCTNNYDKFAEIVHSKLGQHTAIGIKNNEIPILKHLRESFVLKDIWCIPVYKLHYSKKNDKLKFIHTQYIAIFNLNKIESGSCIDMKIPEGSKELFVGSQSLQIKHWCRQLKVNYINLI